MSFQLARPQVTEKSSLVPQEYTHKVNPSEVLLHDWCRTGADSFAVSARWPADHAFYTTRLGMHDPVLLCETVRQTLPLVSHGAYEVPLGHKLLWQDFRWNLNPAALRHDGDVADIDLRITCTDVRRRKERASAVAMNVEAVRGDTLLATATTRFAIQNSAVYLRLRDQYADLAGLHVIPVAPPAPPQQLARDTFEDVVLSPTDTPGRWQLRVDTTHPILFDHPVDHAPGMLLLEAARQAAQAMAHPRACVTIGMDTVFVRYAELDSACWIEATRLPDDPAGNRRVRITGEQRGRDVFSSVVTVGPVPGAGPGPVPGPVQDPVQGD
ncbi:ScbA/BarX family gamma-butyrolactone biosynthesis protein [Streptomyces phyllanthi]|uniref:Transcriptional regulator n=1 Tax=Streptomyces phyllanthi TaxID=1803180 RepID=A0A5N8W994_9ACTN|nr:ScbA/BarX family gamma-butyrolactone biosynthesis protein [Streptomyces phyllanthi]MPY42998.1 transcriptional regulator [Streptomyces phyllanthi]